MKTTSIHHHHRSTVALISCVLLGMAVTSTTLAQNTRDQQNTRDRAEGQNRSNRTDRNMQDTRSGTMGENVRVTRASSFMGMDVISTDGRKVGDIVDYYFDLGDAPHLAYVEIMTGGFLTFGGTRRAVPASALTVTADNAKINMESERFWDAPVLPENTQRFMTDAQNQQRISQYFNQGNQTAGTTGTTRTQNANTDQRQNANTSTSRAGGMTGRQGASQLVSFNELRNSEAYSSQDTRLGYIMDAWVNLNDNRAPYFEITSTFAPFRTNFDRRYAIPMSKLEQKREYYGYTVNTTTDELNQAEAVSETQGVKMLQDGEIGNAVLRVTVPQR